MFKPSILIQSKKTWRSGAKENYLTRLGVGCTKSMWPPNNQGIWSINHSITSSRHNYLNQMPSRHTKAWQTPQSGAHKRDNKRTRKES